MENKTAQKNKTLLAGTIIYAIGNFGTKFLSFIIVPLYTYYILPEDLGTYDVLCTTINLLTPLITMQISDAAFRWMVTNDDNIVPCVSATYKLLAVNCTITAGIILLINCFIPITYCYYFIAILILGRILGSMQKLLRGLKNQKLYATSGLFYTSVFLVLNLVFICVLHQGVEALLWSSVIANVVAIGLILLCEKSLRKVDVKSSHRKLQKEMLKYSMPLVPSTLNWWVMGASDRYVILFFLGSAANGIYAVANKFPSILSTVFLMFNNSWTDMSLADSDSKEDYSAYYSSVFKQLYILSFTSVILLIPATKVVATLILSTAYKEASVYIAFLYLGAVFQAFSSFYGVGYLKDKSTSGAASTSVYGAIVNLAVNILCIKFIGIHAASISTFLGFFAMWAIRRQQMKKSLLIDIQWSLFIFLFAVSVLLSVVSIWTNVAIDLCLTVLGVVFFIWANRGLLKKVCKKILHKHK